MSNSPTGRPTPTPDPDVLRATVHAIGDGVVLANREGRIIYSNPAADRILGVSLVDASLEEWAEHHRVCLPDRKTSFPPEEYPLRLALRGQATDKVEMFIHNEAISDGAVISVTGRPVRDSHGDIMGAVIVFRDITRLRKAEEQKRELTGFLVHDMKSPLTTILASADYLLQVGGFDSDGRESLHDIQQSAQNLHQMVLNMLDVQTAEDGHLDPDLDIVDPIPLMTEVARTTANKIPGGTERIRVEGPDSDQLPPILADRELLRRILTNLLDNCRKYGPEDGRIWLEASTQDPETVLLSVCDEGPGVPSHLRDAIFERYSRLEQSEDERDSRSRGLGLRFCQVAVEAHGGRIWVEDNEPEGARFCVALPTANTLE